MIDRDDDDCCIPFAPGDVILSPSDWDWYVYNDQQQTMLDRGQPVLIIGVCDHSIFLCPSSGQILVDKEVGWSRFSHRVERLAKLQRVVP